MKNLILILYALIFLLAFTSCEKENIIIENSDSIIDGLWEHRTQGNLKFEEIYIQDNQLTMRYDNPNDNRTFYYKIENSIEGTFLKIKYSERENYVVFLEDLEVHHNFMFGWKAGQRIEFIRQ